MIGSLLTYEMSLDDQPEKKSKGMAFNAANSESFIQKSDAPGEPCEESTAMMAKNFGKVPRRYEMRLNNSNGPSSAPFNKDKLTRDYKPGNNYKKGR